MIEHMIFVLILLSLSSIGFASISDSIRVNYNIFAGQSIVIACYNESSTFISLSYNINTDSTLTSLYLVKVSNAGMITPAGNVYYSDMSSVHSNSLSKTGQGFVDNAFLCILLTNDNAINAAHFYGSLSYKFQALEFLQCERNLTSVTSDLTYQQAISRSCAQNLTSVSSDLTKQQSFTYFHADVYFISLAIFTSFLSLALLIVIILMCVSNRRKTNQNYELLSQQ